ncbi:cytochrome b/b6 domain-containing protein [Sphingobium sp. BHU LFT2]|nr:cytochrome b/b6 domain-containing protein [Sphingobium sp. BHU LFT2]
MTAGWRLPPILPTDPTYYAILRDAHGILAWTLFVVVTSHLSAALLHAWVLRDGVFSSMTWKRKDIRDSAGSATSGKE